MAVNLKSPLVEVRKIKDLREMLLGSVAAQGEKEAFLIKPVKNEAYVPVSYKKYGADVEALGTALMQRGFRKDARVAIVAETRYEWYVSYLSVVNGEAIIVPLDKELPEHELESMLRIAEVSCVFFAKTYEQTILDAAKNLPKLQLLVAYDELPAEISLSPGQSVISFESLLAEGQAQVEAGDSEWRTHPIDPEEMRILLFTSGTTSVAKPVMHCHRSICANLMAMCQMIDITPQDVFLSVLPLHHTYECTCGFLCPIYGGSTVAQCEGLRYIIKNLKESQCSVILTVPLMLEAFNRGIWKNIKSDPKQEKLVMRMIGLCKTLNKIGIRPNKKIFKKIHNNFGGKLRLLIAGGAAIDPQVLEDFDHFGFVALQGYGLTECGPILALNRIEARKNNSAGLPLPGVDVKIINPDEYGVGEIVGKGPNIMLGYWNEPEATAAAMEGGYFHSGDLGYLDEDGFVIISGRKKNVVVTKNGKNIYPEELEFALCRSDLISEALVTGEETENGDFDIVAEIFPNEEAVLAANNGNKPEAEALRAQIEEVVKEVNAGLVNYKKIKRFSLRDTEFAKTTSKKIIRKYKD